MKPWKIGAIIGALFAYPYWLGLWFPYSILMILIWISFGAATGYLVDVCNNKKYPIIGSTIGALWGIFGILLWGYYFQPNWQNDVIRAFAYSTRGKLICLPNWISPLGLYMGPFTGALLGAFIGAGINYLVIRFGRKH